MLPFETQPIVVARPDRRWRSIEPAVALGYCAAVLAVPAMAVDHLLVGGEGPGREDLLTFALTVGLSLTLAGFLFAWVVPRASAAGAEHTAKRALTSSLLSVAALPTIWVGLPFALAGSGIALGLLGYDGKRRRIAVASIVIGCIVVLLGVSVYAEQAIRKLA